ncbi:protein phosphatase 2C domain-containing protein [Thermogemmatispora sp.]|uniref:protein phosphatase 2C domain-containing protein n=1 Tax=Thermogemmatispora sp. TaxID=1968838 RepID=UPI0035E441FF
MPLKLLAADKTDVGRQREQNEDCAYRRISPEGNVALFIVADGMGGYRAGEVASRLAVETISQALDSFFQPISEQPTIRLAPPIEEQPTVRLPPPAAEESQAGSSHQDQAAIPQQPTSEQQGRLTVRLPETPLLRSVEERLVSAIRQANSAIIHHGEQRREARGLGCTVTAALVYEGTAYIANVGDSRTYLLREGQLKPLTRDHSLVAKLVEAHQISPEEIYTHPQRNLIYRSLGAGRRQVEVDVFQERLQPGDMLLLCSDGLWEMVRDDEICKTLSERKSLQEICDQLIALANAHGGEDNITALVVRVEAA